MAQIASETPVETPTKKGFSLFAVLALVLVIGLLTLLGWGLVNTTRTRPIAGNPSPDFQVQYYDGYEWQGRDASSLADFNGQVVVLNFWASWCVECRIEADLLQQASQAYENQGVVFLGVAYVDVEPKSREYLTDYNITYPNAPDLRSLVSKAFEITGVPETFIIDQTGEIAYVHIGPIDAPTLYGEINQLVGE
jgi:cytochrome c biogenesis protein CcmG/thiol:disulfide interchange protein DsbE